MKLQDIINSDIRNNIQNLNDFIMMGKVQASNYIREIVSCLVEEQDYLTENNMSFAKWKKAVDVQMNYIIKYKEIYGIDFTEAV